MVRGWPLELRRFCGERSIDAEEREKSSDHVWWTSFHLLNDYLSRFVPNSAHLVGYDGLLLSHETVHMPVMHPPL